MPENQRINSILNAEAFGKSFKVKVGKSVNVPLPKVPMTRDTEFVRLSTHRSGDTENFEVQRAEFDGEGNLSPQGLVVTPLKQGRIKFTIRAEDAITGQEIEGVAPIQIEVEGT